MIATLLALAGCGGGDSELERLISESTTECGPLEFGNGEQTCPASATALACFDGADRPHLTQVFITDEGDPIFEHFFIDGDTIVKIRDTREDDFGPQEITRVECASISESEPTGSGCTLIVCE